MKQSQAAMDLTRGRPLPQILRFSLPLVGGMVLQQMYSFVDTVLVGRLIGADTLAAVGATYLLHFLVLGFVQGGCVGFGIPLAQSIGAKEPDEFKRRFWNGAWLCLALGTALTALALALAAPLLQLVGTPADIFADARTYILIMFAGIPAAMLYNFASSALRAAGDSRHPFYFLAFSSVLNIFLDWLFIAPFGWGVAGAAWATVLSQLVSGLLDLYWIAGKTDLLRGSAGPRGPSAARLRRLCLVGLPMGFEYSVSAIGAVVLQGAINSFGSVAVAGQTAGEKIRQVFTLPMESVGMGVATYAGQNDGAGRYDRIRQGLRAGLTIQWTYCAAAWVVLFFGKGAFTALVLGAGETQAAAYSVQYLSIISVLFCLHGALMVFRNTLQGMGYSLHAVLSGVGELAGRAVGSALAVASLGFASLGFAGICLANPIAWGLALGYCVVMVRHYLRRREAARAAAQPSN